MNTQNENISKFILAINKDAEERRNQILADAEEYKNREMEKAEQDVLQDAYNLIQKETAEMRHSVSRDIASKELEGRRVLLKKREQITENVFKEAENRLIAFSQSNEYEKFLIDSLNEAKHLLSENEITVGIKPDDRKYEKLIKKIISCEIIDDSAILLGGVRIHDWQNGIICDQTLDSRLAEQHESFIKNAGMYCN